MPEPNAGSPTFSLLVRSTIFASSHIVDLLHDDGARTRGALLAGVAERGRDDARGGLVQVRGFVHENRVLAAHLQDRAFEPLLAGLHRGRALVDAEAHLLAAGKRDKARERMIHQHIPHRATRAGQKIKHARGKMQLVHKELSHPCRHDRRRAGRLQHRGVARDDGRGRHAGHNGVREVPRRNHDTHAEWDVVELGLVVRLRMRRVRLAQAQHLPAVELQEIDGLGRVYIRLDPRLAGLEDIQRAELVPALAHDLCCTEQVTRPLCVGNSTPMLERSGGFSHRAVRQLRRGLAHTADDLRWLRRIPAHRNFVGENSLPADDQGIGAAQLPSDLVEAALESLHILRRG